MKMTTEQWIDESLSKILNFEVPEDMVNYIMGMSTENDLNEFIENLLNFDNPQHRNFYKELCHRLFPQKGSSNNKQQKKKITKTKQPQDTKSENQRSVSPDKESKSPGGVLGKKKTKYVNLYSQEGKNAQVVLIKGRHRCDCQASKHELINNCLQCGRVVCKQEGSGPCLYCGNLVCTPEEQREINQKTKASAKLAESLREKGRPKGWEAALSHRNKLLEYDRTSERRTKVTDDDSDYFNTNSVWLSAKERERLTQYQDSLHQKKHASRLDRKVTIDFAGRQIVDDNTIEHEVDEEKIRELSGGAQARPTEQISDWFASQDRDRDVAPGVNAPLLQFDPSVEKYSSVVRSGGGPSSVCRVQDAQLQEMSDSGRCLSMHQPWASLLVEGIKLHEGRSWYSNHRGRLWIASTAKPPDTELFRTLENQYRVLYPDKEFKFPSFYPTGCLLGCVNVDDCLPAEEYQKIYPDGESDSPYVFICSNPVSLRLRFPIKGQHKIYQLDKGIHQAAVKFIQKMSKLEANAG